jgi:U3 small nucleolar RNA-associated protein 20
LALQQAVRSLLLFPHVWVRNASARLLGTLFAAGKSISADDLIEAASQSATQLRSKLLDDSLSLQVVKNLFTIGKHFAAMSDATKEHAETGNAYISDEEADAEGDAEEEAEGAAEQGEPNGQAHRDPKSDPLHWLFVKLSHRARVAHQNRPSLYSAEAVSWLVSARQTSYPLIYSLPIFRSASIAGRLSQHLSSAGSVL